METGSRECAAYREFIRLCHTFPSILLHRLFSDYNKAFSSFLGIILSPRAHPSVNHLSPWLSFPPRPYNPPQISTFKIMCCPSLVVPAVLRECDWKPLNYSWQQSFSLVQHMSLSLQPRVGHSPHRAMQRPHMLLLCSRLLYVYTMM